MASTFNCSLVTPEKAVLDEDVVSAMLPAHDGEIGILRNRAPLMTRLGQGRLVLRFADGSTRRFDLDGGFAQMCDNRLSLLSELATEVETG
ncbi:MAG: F0F1 ATP synthase subunit epsilon [Phycisphaerae bacterium]|nr:F0F1 ATP synthase subunit epsilon [Phycisphaerae bacterium]